MTYAIQGKTIRHDFGVIEKPAEYVPRKALDDYVAEAKRRAQDEWTNPSN